MNNPIHCDSQEGQSVDNTYLAALSGFQNKRFTFLKTVLNVRYLSLKFPIVGFVGYLHIIPEILGLLCKCTIYYIEYEKKLVKA